MNIKKAVKAPPEKPKKKVPRSDTPTTHAQECSKQDFEYFCKNPGGVKNLGKGGKQPRHPTGGHSPGGPARPLHREPQKPSHHNPAKRREYTLLTPYYTGAGPGHLPKSRWQELEEHRFIPRWEMEDMLAAKAREALARLPTQAQATAAAARKVKLRREQEAEAQARATMEKARIEAERAQVGAEAKARFEAQVRRQAEQEAFRKAETGQRAVRTISLPGLPVAVKSAAPPVAIPDTGVPKHLKGFLAQKLEEELGKQVLSDEKKARLIAWAWETKGLRITL